MEHNASTYESLVAGLGESVPKWSHEGDLLVGVLTDLDTFEGEYGSCPTVTVRAAEGSTEEHGSPINPGEQRCFYASRTVSRKKVEKALRAGLKVGDRVAIRHFGIPEGREYHDYALKFEPVGAAESDAEPVTSESPLHADGDIPF